MAAPIQCPRGHWYTPADSDKTPFCPYCKAQSQLRSGPQISEDEVLDILGPADEVDLSPPPVTKPPVEVVSHGSEIHRRKKVCTSCSYEVSVSFGCCPRCGGPLTMAVLKVK